MRHPSGTHPALRNISGMTRLVCIASVVTLAVPVRTSNTPGAAQDPQARIRAASAVLLAPPDPSITQAAIVNALVELLDVAVSLTRDSPYAEDIKHHVDIARDLMLKTSLFNEKARQYLSFAYRMMSAGKKYERPKELNEFVTPAELQEKSRKYCAALVDGALAALESGQKSDAGRLVLELVLGVVTPVSP